MWSGTIVAVRGAERLDEPAVVERPGRVAVDHDDGLALALVEVVQPQAAAVEVAAGVGGEELGRAPG